MIEIIERGPDGAYVTVPDPGAAPASVPVVPQEQNGTTAETAPPGTGGVQGESAPPPEDAPPPAEASLAASPEAEGEDADVADDAATVPFVNRRIKQLNAKRRETEKLLAEERQQNALRQAQLEARLDTLTKVLSGAAPAMPEAPAQPTGPPQAEQFERHEEFVQAAANYAADQRIGQERQQAQQMRFQQDLMSREQHLRRSIPTLIAWCAVALPGKCRPVLQQALMLVPDGPAVAYTLAKQPELVQRLNTLPPPLVLVELGRLTPRSSPGRRCATAGQSYPNGGITERHHVPSHPSAIAARADGACGGRGEYGAADV